MEKDMPKLSNGANFLRLRDTESTIYQKTDYHLSTLLKIGQASVRGKIEQVVFTKVILRSRCRDVLSIIWGGNDRSAKAKD